MPLFDRLSDRAAEQPRDQSRRGVQLEIRASVQRELHRLLNTRCSEPVEVWEKRELTVVEYGIPDLSAFHSLDGGDRRRLEDIIGRAIDAYEPRLTDVRVHLEAAVQDGRSASGWIEATLIASGDREPLLFATTLDPETGNVRIDATA
jgi:type VI secretion system lysozyme-like protein